MSFAPRHVQVGIKKQGLKLEVPDQVNLVEFLLVILPWVVLFSVDP